MPRKDSSSSSGEGGSKKKKNTEQQRFRCEHPGCGKSYSRQDHLQRHRLNHDSDNILACTQCDRTFVRQDLLIRHLERHAVRGKNLGRWMNRVASDAPPAAAASSSPRQSQRKRRKVDEGDAHTASAHHQRSGSGSDDDGGSGGSVQGGSSEDDEEVEEEEETAGASQHGAAPPHSSSFAAWSTASPDHAQPYPQAPPPYYHHHHQHHQHQHQYHPPSASSSMNGSGGGTDQPSMYSAYTHQHAHSAHTHAHAYQHPSTSAPYGAAAARAASAQPYWPPPPQPAHAAGAAHKATVHPHSHVPPPPPPAASSASVHPAAHHYLQPVPLSLQPLPPATAEEEERGPTTGAGAILPKLALLAPADCKSASRRSDTHSTPSAGGSGTVTRNDLENGGGGGTPSAAGKKSASYAPPPSGPYYSEYHQQRQQHRQHQQHHGQQQLSRHASNVLLPSSGRRTFAFATGASGSSSSLAVSPQLASRALEGAGAGATSPPAGLIGGGIAPGGGFAGVAAATSGQDSFPFAPPLSFNEADYSWLFDGLDPFNASAGASAGAGAFASLDSHAEFGSAALDALAASGTHDSFPGDMHHPGFSPVSSDGIGPGPAFPPEARTPSLGGTLLIRPAPAPLAFGPDGATAPSAGTGPATAADSLPGGTLEGNGDSVNGGMVAVGSGAQMHAHVRAAADGDSHSTGVGSVAESLASLRELDPMNSLDELAFFASLQAEIPDEATYNVDADTHSRLLRFLTSVHELHTSPLFAPAALQCYIFLFFKHIHVLWPLIHKPTFNASTADPMLLSAIIVNGMHYADTPSHELAVRIGQKLWGAYVSLDDFRPARATLPMLQALLLTELFGKLMSNRAQHEMGHLFHNFIITLARRNAVFSPVAVILPGPDGSDQQWRAWAREEEKRRIAFFAFMLDSSHAALFRHIPALSAFQVQLLLPCHEDEWRKDSPDAWFKYRRSSHYRPSTPFIQAVKASLSPAGIPPALDTFSKYILLHGLISIAFDLQWKQVNVLMGADTEAGVSNWRERLSAAYSSWKSRMDQTMLESLMKGNRSMYKSSTSLVCLGQIVLHCDCVDLQIFAGLPSVLGKFIDRGTYYASKMALKEWAASPMSPIAVWYSVNFLRSFLLGTGPFATVVFEDDYDESDGLAKAPHANGTESPNRPLHRKGLTKQGLDYDIPGHWVCYLSSLTIWAYGIFTGHRNRALDSSSKPWMCFENPTRAPSLSDAASAAVTSVSSRRREAPLIVNFREDEAAACLERLATRTPEELQQIDVRSNVNGMLELVYREVRTSRWALGREAAGVLRKLFTAPAAPTTAVTPAQTRPNTPRGDVMAGDFARSKNGVAPGAKTADKPDAPAAAAAVTGDNSKQKEE
ncbi:hypothetical protein K437DRAFT_258781 [Tilletiaria anomala UBC 951]|uniref:C2H2-type domain-containing protein n=1 Tax=Tilletiaria anomala (strain ATCC 24038 / CBS 436.72 / UBC 951) TaxID=1037660 RepID=A0A066VND5_TILAU|nr:uncharacterized protein K437DRAFT_258781 [Tilletiaria anomala UBC 951]KDN40100.1 hypothetical protein K437DRAFT_258781 [Tilletiaria anomala UBC 951]